jgi:hypothetical protein
MERGRTAVQLAAGRALASIRTLPAVDARAALERITQDLVGGAPPT